MSEYPTNRGMPACTDEALGYPGKPTAAEKEIPWIDIHQHTQTLPWEVHERMDLSGAHAVVMIAASYFQVPYRPIHPEDWRLLWDEAIRQANAISRNHFFDVYLACGIHMGAKVERVDELLSVLPEYCALEETVAIGETGIDPVNRGGVRWPLSEQKRVVRRQMEIAADQELPVIIHTPKSKHDPPRRGSLPLQFNVREAGKFGSGIPNDDPQIPLEDAKLEGVKMNVEQKEEAGLPDDLLVLDHADMSVVEYVMEETDCWLSFSLIRSVEEDGPEEVARVIEEYGPDRLMIDTDMLSGLYAGDAAFTMKRAILDLLRLGVPPEDVRQVVYGNQLELLGIDG